MAVGGSASAKKVAVGGKLGIVKDPFGKQGAPEYLAATLPLDGYGIVNLSLSEDGKVVIGQLKGGFSADILGPDANTSKPSEAHAWNVEALIQAALHQPEKDRNLKKHITLDLDPDAEQRISTAGSGFAGTIGTAFDPDVVNVSSSGRMGDVVGVDLKELAARRLLVTERILNVQDLTTPREMLTQYALLQISKRMADLSDFYLSPVEIQNLTDKTTAGGIFDNLNPAMKLVTDNTGKPISRFSSDGADFRDRLEANFTDTGVLFLVPDITEADLVRLRAGNTVNEKFTNFNFTFKDAKAKPDLTSSATNLFTRTGLASVTAKDYANTPNIFFGDRPLDNPGYSQFTLKGEVKAGVKTNDVLDVYRVEQRLKYLGYSAFKEKSVVLPWRSTE